MARKYSNKSLGFIANQRSDSDKTYSTLLIFEKWKMTYIQ